MTNHQLTHLRLLNQCISITNIKTPEDVVRWMGCMQAQDLSMAKWAVGLRMQKSTIQTVDEALNKGDILRTHILRPTWHLVASTDISWILEITAPRIKASLNSRHKQLGFTSAMLDLSYRILIEILSGNRHLTREDISLHFNNAGLSTDENRLSHLLLCAELEKIICSGSSINNKPTYALFDERIPQQTAYTKETALKNLAIRYFQSHGPATLPDFNWWSGLSAKEAREAFEMVRSGFESITLGPDTYLYSNPHQKFLAMQHNLFLLPAFDEYLISYKNRAAMLTSAPEKVVSNNGIFRPMIVLDGEVIGIWKRQTKKDTISIETQLFKAIDKQANSLIAEAANRYGNFYSKKVVIS
ncbi:MAG: winged helix DNA-binding domain-containing protein [Bacteroidales bacterium]|nr:winged helix DNA-binding domain-containing protein [Bacteroidales bacterium]